MQKAVAAGARDAKDRDKFLDILAAAIEESYEPEGVTTYHRAKADPKNKSLTPDQDKELLHNTARNLMENAEAKEESATTDKERRSTRPGARDRKGTTSSSTRRTTSGSTMPRPRRRFRSSSTKKPSRASSDHTSMRAAA